VAARLAAVVLLICRIDPRSPEKPGGYEVKEQTALQELLQVAIKTI